MNHGRQNRNDSRACRSEAQEVDRRSFFAAGSADIRMLTHGGSVWTLSRDRQGADRIGMLCLLMPDHRGFHQIMQIPGLVEIKRLGVAFDLQHWIRCNFAAEIFA